MSRERRVISGARAALAIEDAAAPGAVPSRLLPNLLGIGAAKSGTTWLAGVLAAHPDIFMPPQKELNALHYEDLDARIWEFAAHFRDAGARRIRCDFSVRYLASPRAPAAAARLVPDAKILAVLRNPVDQVQSHYWHLVRQNFHQGAPVRPRPDLFAALERFPDLLREPALYGKHLLRWRERFLDQQMLVLTHERLTRSRDDALAQLCRFLEVEPFDFSEAASRRSASDGRRGVQPRGGLAGRVFPSLYAGIAQGPYRWLKQRIGVQSSEALKRALRLREISEAVFFKPGYPKLEARERARLQEIFAADVELLASRFDIDVTPWRAVA